MCHPTFTDKKVSRPHGHKKLKVLCEFRWQSFWSTRLTKMSQWLHQNNSHAYPFCKTTPGTISESHQQSCAIELQQQFFRCSNCDHIFVSVTCSKRSRNYSVSESEGAPRIYEVWNDENHWDFVAHVMCLLFCWKTEDKSKIGKGKKLLPKKQSSFLQKTTN